MKLQFVKEGKSTFAIVEDVEYKGKMCEELLFADIYGPSPFFSVMWEDNYKSPEQFNKYEDAIEYIKMNFHKHTPHINGKSYEIKEG